MQWKWLCLLVISYFLYLLVGGAIFMAIEQPSEKINCEEAKKELDDILGENRDISTFSMEQLKNLSKVIQQYGVEVDVDNNFTATCTSNWDFQNAFFFSGTVVTTIGYGNISPQTNGGRTFCIFYALVGIPLFAVMFSGLGEKIAKQVKKLDKMLKIKTKRQFVHRLAIIGIVASALCVFCLLIPAAIFMAVEGWSYLEAFYYSFITLTTIGFGDFVIGTNPDVNYIPIYRVLVYFWIVFGLAFMATVVSLISEFMKKTGKKATDHIGDLIDNDQGEKDATDPGSRAEGDGGSSDGEASDEAHASDKPAPDTRLNSNKDPSYGANEDTKRTEEHHTSDD